MDATEKTLSVLDALGTSGRNGGTGRLGDIAQRADLPKSTVHRILKRLVARGYARAEGGGVYVPGPRILAMAGEMLHRLDAGPFARPILRDLHADVGNTVHFAMLSGDEAIYVEKLEDPDLPYQTASRVGMRIPLHCTAIGKSLLAAMAPDEARDLLTRHKLIRHTPRTLVSPAAVRAELERVRDRGFAIDDEENERNIRCVGSAVVDYRGRPIGAISVTALTVELSLDGAVELGPRVAAAAQALSDALGATPAPR
jgi:IclR family transcriptional regulator, acetate operon repressor